MTAPGRPELTGVELTVIERSAAGDTYERMARDLGVERHVVRQWASRAFRKLGATTMPQAVILACRAGLLDGKPFLRHGDHAGYEAHIRRRIPLCDACRDGEKAYRDGLKAARQAQEAPCVPASAPFSAPMDSGPSGLENASEAHSPASRPTNQTKPHRRPR